MAAMCGRCARKLQHLRVPWHLSVRSLCAAPSNSPSFEVDEGQLSGIESSVSNKRDPLAVLKALVSTVKPTPHLPNPEFIEDIFLLPRSKVKQDACLAAKQSGREAAEFVIKRCPGIFPLREPNPMWISEERVKLVDVKTEKDLKYFIKTGNARNAILAYERLKEQGVEVSLDTENELLDLAAQRLGNIPAKHVLTSDEGNENNKEDIESVRSEESKMASEEEGVNDADSDVFDQENENITTSAAAKDNHVTPEWRDDNYALQMFHSMKTKNGKTYETMVLGFMKYRGYFDAYNLFKEMRQLGYQASLFTYNLLFKAISRSQHIDAKWEAAKDLVKNMSEEPVVIPDLKTYNTLMKVVVASSQEDVSRTDLAFGIIRDIMAAGLEPTLDSYNQLLRAAYIQHWDVKKELRKTGEWQRKMNVPSPVTLNKIITHLESLAEFPPLKDPDDALFFRTAMSAALLCTDVKLAIRIYDLLEKQNNKSYLGLKQAPFYSSFLLTLTTAEADCSIIYNYYQEIVPHKFKPKEHIYTSLFNMVVRTNNPGVVKRFYQDMRKNRVQLTTKVAVAMFRALGLASDPQQCQENLLIMLDLLRWLKMYRLEITHVMITQLIRMYCLNDQLENAWETLNMFQENRIPIPTYTALNDVLLKACREKDEFKVLRLFEMLAKYGYNLNRKRRLHLYDTGGLATADRRRIDVMFSDMAVLDQRRRQYFPDKQEKSQEFDPFN